MRPLLATLFLVSTACVAVAEVRVYQPPVEPAAPTVSRGITPAVPQPSPAAVGQPKPPVIQGNAVMTNPLTGEMREAPAMPRQLEIFLATSDLPHLLPRKLGELTTLPELRKLGLQPDIYVNESGVQAMLDLLPKLVPLTVKGGNDEDKPPPMPANLPDWNIGVDNGNELAQSYGIQNQSTIVYRDPTGAVRLYNLSYEVEKLQRQLAREIEGAQPAR